MSDSARRRYLDEFASSIGVARTDVPSTHVLIEDSRAGSNLIVGYVFDAITVVRAAPEHADLVMPLHTSERSRTHEELRDWAPEIGWVDFDGSLSHVVDRHAVRDAEVPSGLQAVRLEPNGADNERIVSWLTSAHPDDVEAADFDVDELDDRMVALVDESEQIVAVASSYATDEVPQFEDIGVIVCRNARGRGLGRVVVRQLLDDLHVDDQLGLYRCNWSNPWSRQLALSLGFEEILSLIALCPEGDPKAAG